MRPPSRKPVVALGRVLIIVLAAALAVSRGARAVVSGQCVQARGGNSCTAGDVTFVLVGLGTVSNGCVAQNSGTITMLMGATVSNTAAQDRYDIGMYINTDPTGSTSGLGAAYDGTTCAREMLKPAGPLFTGSVPSCTTDTPAGPYNLAGGSGPFINVDGNACSDLLKKVSSTTCDTVTPGTLDDSHMTFTDPITFPCKDLNPATGFLQIPTCATWGNRVGEVNGGVCNSESDVMPGTGSKCNCAITPSNVPAPNLGLSCACSPTPVRPGQSTKCTVSFTNTFSPACSNPTPPPAERFRCGAAGFIRWKVNYDTTKGQVLNYTGACTTNTDCKYAGQACVAGTCTPTQPSTPSETTGGTTAVNSTSGLVTWTPKDLVANGGTLGIVSQNESGSMSYQYYVNTGTAAQTINQTVQTYYSNAGTFSPESLNTALSTTCTFSVDPNATWAGVSSFTAREEGGQVVVEWETAAEVGTVGFEVERRDPATGRFVKVAEHALPAVGQLPGGRYLLADPAAPRGERLTYRLVEVDQQGGRQVFGPYQVAPSGGARRPREERGRDFSATAKGVSPRLARAAMEAIEKATRSAAAAAPGRASHLSRAKIEVTESGMYRVRAQDIGSALGMPAAEAAARLRAGQLRLSNAGQDVAWQPAADGNGLVFYAAALHTPYTDSNVYWLDPGDGQLVATAVARPASGPAAAAFVDTVHLETDAIPAIASPVPVPDFWIWKSFFPGFPGFDSATVSAPVPVPAAGAATLAVNLYGFAALQRANLIMNGRFVGRIEWPGVGPYTASLALPPDMLRDGDNEIELDALEGERGFWLDSFDLTYPRLYRAQQGRIAFRADAGAAVALGGFPDPDVSVYDLSQPLAPRRLLAAPAQPLPDGTWGVSFAAPASGPYFATTGGALLRPIVVSRAPADLRGPGNKADYLVISPVDLRSEAQRLAELRAAQGLSALVVDLDDVIDVFSDGIPDPLAIRRFLAYAVANWQTPPRYVALAGKGSYDPRNLLGLFSNLLPPLLIATGDGLAPADAEYADFDDSGVPAVAIGRIPALSLAEMHDYVNKLAAYEANPGGPWTRRELLVADHADAGGDFAATSQALAATLPPGLVLTRVNVPPSPSPAQMQASRSQLADALRRGQVMMSYVGHGGLDRLSSEGLLLTTDVPQLGNAPRLPVMTALTCLLAEFAYPTVTSLGEDLVMQADGGAVALYGPTWLSYNAPAGDFGQYLLPELSAAGGGRLGDRLLRGLSAYAAAGGDRQMLRLYTLLGDPALAVKR
jgi:Peptidase family C25